MTLQESASALGIATAPGLAETASEPAHDETRTRLPTPPPGYDLLRLLGGGGMGDVFLAREHATERIVAMKFLRATGNPFAIERFLTEVRAVARLDHPNIIRIFATDFLRSEPYFTMEHASGGTLASRVVENGPLPADDAARIIAIVARAVETAHRTGVLHRDLKPSNVLLTDRGDPIVADFGLAKRTDLNEGLTIGTSPLGTPGFMPPEQVSRRHGKSGVYSDIYGLGETLYYLLTGRPPFTGESVLEIAAQVENTLPERLRALRPELPAALEGIVLKCLEKDPAHRYTTAANLANDLERFLAGQKPSAPC